MASGGSSVLSSWDCSPDPRSSFRLLQDMRLQNLHSGLCLFQEATNATLYLGKCTLQALYFFLDWGTFSLLSISSSVLLAMFSLFPLPQGRLQKVLWGRERAGMDWMHPGAKCYLFALVRENRMRGPQTGSKSIWISPLDTSPSICPHPAPQSTARIGAPCLRGHGASPPL